MLVEVIPTVHLQWGFVNIPANTATAVVNLNINMSLIHLYAIRNAYFSGQDAGKALATYNNTVYILGTLSRELNCKWIAIGH